MKYLQHHRLFTYAKTRRRSAQLISGAFVFATWIVESLLFFNTKFQASMFLLGLYRPVCVGPGRKPRRPGFSCRGSHHIIKHGSSSVYTWPLEHSWQIYEVDDEEIVQTIKSCNEYSSIPANEYYVRSLSSRTEYPINELCVIEVTTTSLIYIRYHKKVGNGQ